MLASVFRTVIVYVAVITAMRLMGKRQLGELQPAELVTTFLISNVASICIDEPDLPLAAIRSQIASALDIMIHLGRLRDKSRKVLWITEVGDYEEGEIRLNALYRFEDTKEKGTLKKVGELKAREKLWAAGDSL